MFPSDVSPIQLKSAFAASKASGIPSAFSDLVIFYLIIIGELRQIRRQCRRFTFKTSKSFARREAIYRQSKRFRLATARQSCTVCVRLYKTGRSAVVEIVDSTEFMKFASACFRHGRKIALAYLTFIRSIPLASKYIVLIKYIISLPEICSAFYQSCRRVFAPSC
jgi:hypothetical protein